MPHEHHSAPQAGAVLDIGGTIGALLLYVTPDDLDREIHVAPADDPGRTVHTVARNHPLPGGGATPAALFPELPAGRYDIVGHELAVTIRGGHVTEQHLS